MPSRDDGQTSSSHHYMLLGLSPSDEQSREIIEQRFDWCGRTCSGNVFHRATLEGNMDQALRLLDDDPLRGKLVESRFTFEMVDHQGHPHICSGEAIHLAASRGDVAMVSLLLEHRASLDACVTRDGLDNYDVLHTAIIGTGSGGTKEMVNFLLQSGASMTINLRGEWPLHKAFQTGKVQLIELIRNELRRRGMPDIEATLGRSPLELGISCGRMSEEDLIAVAPLTTNSLKLFSQLEPRCIKKWLQRCEHVSAAELATSLTALDLANVFRGDAVAGATLLTRLTDAPEVENIGWHPLPIRVSFASQNIAERIHNAINPLHTHLEFYMPTSVWEYNAKYFQFPPWHQQICHRKMIRPVRDVDVKVCRVPNLCCANLFLSIEDSKSSDESVDDLFVYQNDVIRSLISYTWWNAAWVPEALHLFFSLWGLVLLILQDVITVMDPQIHHINEGALRQLQARGSSTFLAFNFAANSINSTSIEVDSSDVSEVTHCVAYISASFLASRGFLDLVRELSLYLGYRTLDAAQVGNFWTIWRIWKSFCLPALPILLLFDPSDSFIGFFVIFVYWSRLLKVRFFSEKTARVLLPIVDLRRRLGPSCVLTIVFGLAFTHAYWQTRGPSARLFKVILESFSVLFTAALPEMTTEASLSELILTYVSILVFSMFLLNLFIGVISEQYLQLKARVALRHQQERCGNCSAYLLRSRGTARYSFVIQTLKARFALFIIPGLGMLSLQAWCFFYRLTPTYISLAFILCMTCMSIACQSDERNLGRNVATAAQDDSIKTYLWLVTTRDSSSVDQQLLELTKSIEETRAQIAGESSDGVDVKAIMSRTSSVANQPRISKRRQEVGMSPASNGL